MLGRPGRPFMRSQLHNWTVRTKEFTLMFTRSFSSRLSSLIAAVIAVALLVALSATALSQTQPAGPKTAPPSKKAVTKKSAPAPKADVLNNQAVLKLVEAGLDDTLICAKIRSAEKAEFQLDTDSIIELK